MLPEEQASNSRYFYELASAKFGWSLDKVTKVQAFHFKGGQGAKTGTGGHLPGNKVVGKIAEVRELEPGSPAINPSRFNDLVTNLRIPKPRLLTDSGCMCKTMIPLAIGLINGFPSREQEDVIIGILCSQPQRPGDI